MSANFHALPLDRLIAQVARELSSEGSGSVSAVQGLVQAYNASSEDWKKYAIWDPEAKYTRNLISSDGKTYTLMVLCWNPGKWSPCHDHSGSQCLMRILSGELTEIRYSKELVPTQTTQLTPGQVYLINDSLGVHSMGNNSATNKACSLHLYMPPYTKCRGWLDPSRADLSSECTMTFHSVAGVVCASKSPCK